MKATIAGRWRMTPAANAPASLDTWALALALKVLGLPRLSRKLKWMCVPLPIPATAVLGAKLACHPLRRATSRAIARTAIERSAAKRAGAGRLVISNWSWPNSRMNISGSVPA